MFNVFPRTREYIRSSGLLDLALPVELLSTLPSCLGFHFNPDVPTGDDTDDVWHADIECIGPAEPDDAISVSDRDGCGLAAIREDSTPAQILKNGPLDFRFLHADKHRRTNSEIRLVIHERELELGLQAVWNCAGSDDLEARGPLDSERRQ